ncbi:MAG: pentapeptide repeat-containing protein [Acidobacteriota bacterium]
MSDATVEQANDLRARVHDLERKLSLRERETRLLAIGSSLLFFGPRLARAFRRWLRAREQRGTLPIDETADLLAVVVRRVVGMRMLNFFLGALTFFIASIVPALLLMQQNQLLEEQITSLKIQATQEAADRRVIRRNALIKTIFDCRNEGSRCIPLANRRERNDAVKEFIHLERSQNRQIDLAQADLSTLRFGPWDLSGADLSGALLDQALFEGTKLTRVKIVGSSAVAARLVDVDLRNAVLVNSDFTRAKIATTDLSNAQLRRVDLSGAQLIDVTVSGTTMMDSVIDRATVIPDELRPSQ